MDISFISNENRCLNDFVNISKTVTVNDNKNSDIEDSYLEGQKQEIVSETYDKNGKLVNQNSKTNSILPKENKNSLQGYIYYKGERMTQHQFLEKAVESGEYEYDENENINYNYSKAWKALVEDKAKPLYSWSSTLYSEDGMYVFRVENGQITGASATKLFNGTDMQEIANQLASGMLPSEIKGDTSWLMYHDRELYDAATRIGSARKNFEYTEQEYNSGHLSKERYLKELEPLFMILFGENKIDENKIPLIKSYFSQNVNDYVKNAFENYNPERYKRAYGLG